MTQPVRTTATGRARAQGSAGEVFRAFLKLGVTSFGGPVAHLGYFRDELVLRRKWIDEAGFADLVTLCQFLPGPASSQVGFALGLLRGGPLGAVAAWAAFTLPSALLLVLFASSASAFAGPLGAGVLHGLKIVAVAVVAQAVWGMARTLAPDRVRGSIALAAVLTVVFAPGSAGQIAAIVMGGLAGLWLCRGDAAAPAAPLTFAVPKRAGRAALALFLLLFFLLPALAGPASLQGFGHIADAAGELRQEFDNMGVAGATPKGATPRRDRGLLMHYLLDPAHSKIDELKQGDPLLAWAISFPGSPSHVG